MDPEKIELFKTSNEAPVVDTEKDKQEILKNLERELANKQQELAVLEPELRLVPAEELTAKKGQLEQEIEVMKSQRSALSQEVAPPQTEIRVDPEQTIKPEAPAGDFKITMETDPDFLKKKFAEQGIGSGPIKAEQINSDLGQTTEPEKTTKEKLNELHEKTNQGSDDIGKEYTTKINDAGVQSQAEQSIEQPPVGQFETPEQLSEEAKTEKKSVLAEIFSNPEAERRIQEIQTELDKERDEIQALEEAIAERKQKVKSLESEKDKLEQEGLAVFFRNVRNFEAANRRGATGATRGGVAGELRAALEKYEKIKDGKIQDQSFVEKVMKKLSAKMRKVFYELYPGLASKKAKVEKAKKLAKVKKAKSTIRGRGLVGNEGMSIA